PRSADSTVVRRANAIESFRVDPANHRLEHDSWQYAHGEHTFHPSDGLGACHAATACSPGDGVAGRLMYSESPRPYLPSLADPAGTLAPQLTQSSTPVTAFSPNVAHIAAVFVDDNGRLYISRGAYADSTSNAAIWQTWLLATGLPPRAPVAVVPAK